MADIQVVDIGTICLAVENPTESELLAVGEAIVSSFRESGFAYLKAHGIKKRLQDDTFQVARQFFSLHDKNKMDYERFVKTGYNGFTPIGGENSAYSNPQPENLVDYKECYDLHILGEDYPKVALSQLGPQLEQMALSCRQLSRRLLAALQTALAAGQLLTSCHTHMLEQGGCTEMRVLHYPPVPATMPANTVRCASHTDYGTFTLLFQDGVGGLEVQTSPDVWTPAEPLPDSNPGQHWRHDGTVDRRPAARHPPPRARARARTPPTRRASLLDGVLCSARRQHDGGAALRRYGQLQAGRRRPVLAQTICGHLSDVW